MFVHYLDAFDASGLPPFVRQTVAGATVPALVRTLEEEGCTPVIGSDLQRIAEIQSANADRMRLFQPFNPIFQPRSSAKDTVVLILERDGEPHACAATRLLWIGESLAMEMQSLRLFYANVPGMSRPQESVIVTAPSADLIGDCYIGMTGAVFARKGESAVAVKAMMRLLHLWVFVHWKWSWLTGIADRLLLRHYAYDTYGFTSAELGLWREGREYMLLTAPRRYYAKRIADPSFHDITIPLGEPTNITKIRAEQMAESSRARHEAAAA